MREIEKQNPNIYNNGRSRSTRNSAFNTIGWLTVLIAVVGGIYMQVGAKDPLPPNVPSVLAVQPTQAASGSYDPFSNGNMPNRIAMSLNDLDLYSDQLLNIQTDISVYHQQSWEERDIKQYQAKLVEGIEICDNYLIYLEDLKIDSELQLIWLAKYNDVKNLKTAYQYYLDYTHTRRSSDIDMGNHFTILSNEHNFNNSLIKYLKQKNYRYALDKDGGVRFWYSK